MLKSITMLLAGSLFFYSCSNGTAKHSEKEKIKATTVDPKTDWNEVLMELKPIKDEILIRMPYADTSNFTHTRLYPCEKCLLRRDIANIVMKAAEMANKEGNQLILFDCYRPYSVQERMYKLIRDERYVAKPGKGSFHNKGIAIDAGLTDAEGKILDMGSEFDAFSERSRFNYQGLTKQQRANRDKLNRIMKEAGLNDYPHEWWHFYLPDTAAETYNFPLPCE